MWLRLMNKIDLASDSELATTEEAQPNIGS